MPRLRHATIAALLLLALPAAAQRAPDALVIGNAAAVTSIDPHYHNLGPNNALGMHVFDRLVERDSRARPHPSLAESYRALSDTVWEFRLRQGVTWQDGR